MSLNAFSCAHARFVFKEVCLTSSICCSRAGDHEEIRKAAVCAPWKRRKALTRVMHTSLDGLKTFVTEVHFFFWICTLLIFSPLIHSEAHFLLGYMTCTTMNHSANLRCLGRTKCFQIPRTTVLQHIVACKFRA